MKLLITTAALSLLLGTSAYALQSQDRNKDKPAPQDERRKQEQPDKEKDKDRQPDKRQPDRDRTQDTKPQQQRDRDREQPDRDRAQNQDRDRQSERDSGRHGHRIPDDRFRASFGREHTFHVRRGGSGGGGQVGEGQRFQYGGYWFEYGEPWPGEWSYDDDFYVDSFDDDYYLYDVRYPRERILIIVVE